MSDEQPFDVDKMPSSIEEVHYQPSSSTNLTRGRSYQTEWKRGSVDYVKLLMRYKLWLVCGMISGLLIGHLIFQKLGPEYDATAKVLVSKRVAVPIREDAKAETWGERGEHIALIMSPLIVESAVERGKLRELPTLRLSKDPVEDIIYELRVKRSAGHDRSVLNVLDITYKSTKREDAKIVVNAIIDAYKAFLADQHRQNAGELVARVNRAKNDIRVQIDAKEDEYQVFRDSAPIHLKTPTRGANGERITTSTNVHQENLEALDKERQLVLVKKAEAQSKVDAIDAALESGQSREELAASIQLFAGAQTKSVSPTSITVGGVPNTGQNDLDTCWLTLTLQERKLLREYGQDWPEVVAIREQKEALKDFYRLRGGRVPGEPALANNPAGNSNGQQSRFGISGAGNAAAGGADLVNIYMLWLRQELNRLVLREKELNRIYSLEFQKARDLSKYLVRDRRINNDIDRLNGLWNSIEVQLAKLEIKNKTQATSCNLFLLREISFR